VLFDFFDTWTLKSSVLLLPIDQVLLFLFFQIYVCYPMEVKVKATLAKE